jgi:hypothetical protein
VPFAKVGVSPRGFIFPDDQTVWQYSSNDFSPEGENFTSAVWARPDGANKTTYVLFTFNDAGALKVTPGWDNVTGYGTPNGMPFIHGVAKIANQTP